MCIPCQKNTEKFYQELSKVNGKTYLKYKVGNNTIIIEEDDFNTAIQNKQIPATTKAEILV